MCNANAFKQTKITTNKKFYDNNTREQHTHETGENASIRRCRLRHHHRHTSQSIIKTLKEKANHDFMDRDDDVKQICAKTCKVK